MRLLLLEDDEILGAGLRGFLKVDGHAVDWCRRLGEAQALRHETFDALLVDWHLPDGSGLDWVRALRARGDHTPVVILTARDLLSDRILGLDSGADDYLVKPFDPEELVARIRAVCRRASGTSSPRLDFGDIQVDIAARTMTLNNQPVELTAREWAVAEALVLRAGRLVSKADLESLVMGLDGGVASNALEVYIYSLRKKLGRQHIETSRGMGYRWVRHG